MGCSGSNTGFGQECVSEGEVSGLGRKRREQIKTLTLLQEWEESIEGFKEGSGSWRQQEGRLGVGDMAGIREASGKADALGEAPKTDARLVQWSGKRG